MPPGKAKILRVRNLRLHEISETDILVCSERSHGNTDRNVCLTLANQPASQSHPEALRAHTSAAKTTLHGYQP